MKKIFLFLFITSLLWYTNWQEVYVASWASNNITSSTTINSDEDAYSTWSNETIDENSEEIETEQSTGSTNQNDIISEQLDSEYLIYLVEEYKELLLSSLDKNNKSQRESLNLVLSWYNNDEAVNLLKELWEIDFDSPYMLNLSDYIDLKWQIVLTYNNIVSNLSILEDKYELEIFTESQYTSKLKELKKDIENFKSKNETLINNFFEESVSRIWEYNDSIDQLKDEKEILLDNIKSLQINLSKLEKKYVEYEDLVSKINSLYIWNFKDIEAFMDQANQLLIDSLERDLDQIIWNYYRKYINLSYYDEDIEERKKSMLDTYKLELNDYFAEVFSWFYSESDIDFIDNNYDLIKNRYYESWTLSLKLLKKHNTLPDEYYDLIEKIDNVTDEVRYKLQEFDYPNSKNDIKNRLTYIIEDYNDEKKVQLKDKFEKYMDKQVELLGFKVSEELQKFNAIKNRLDWLELYDDEFEKYYAINDFQKSLEKTKTDMISIDLKTQIDRYYWELEVEEVNILLKDWVYDRYENDYDNLEETLKTIVLNLSNQFIETWQIDVFDKKIEKALSKIDWFLSDPNIWNKSKYLLLNIKKAFVWYLYLR